MFFKQKLISLKSQALLSPNPQFLLPDKENPTLSLFLGDAPAFPTSSLGEVDTFGKTI